MKLPKDWGSSSSSLKFKLRDFNEDKLAIELGNSFILLYLKSNFVRDLRQPIESEI